MGDSLEVKDLCEHWSNEPLAEGNCTAVRRCGEEAGEQKSDLMDKNRVRRR
jgi:hypothetical protein